MNLEGVENLKIELKGIVKFKNRSFLPLSGHMVSKNEINKLAIYKELAKYKEVEDIPFQKITKKYNLSKVKYGGLISSIRRSPKVYRALRSIGYSAEQIPQWFKRKKEE